MYTIYSKEGCSFCTAAANLLDIEKKPYKYLVLDEDFTMDELLEKAPNARSFPQIFLDDTLVGGYSDLVYSLI